jgi:pimeloyl-ACP methyl ester carboxylesterase
MEDLFLSLLGTLNSLCLNMVNVTNIVFVHGAWADGSCWSKVMALVSAKGSPAYAPDDVASATNAQDGPVLLTGHSYGGSVITLAGNDPKVAGLMYVAAFGPDKGDSPLTQASAYPTTKAFTEAVPIEDGYVLLSKKGIYDYFAQDLALRRN